jgi:hypothetical protein
MKKTVICLLMALSLPVVACATAKPINSTTGATPSPTPTVSEARSISVTLKFLPGRSTLMLPYDSSSVHHVVLKVNSNQGTETPFIDLERPVQKLVVADKLTEGGTILANFVAGTPYRVRAYVYSSADENENTLINDPDATYIDVLFLDNVSLATAELPIVMVPRPKLPLFSGSFAGAVQGYAEGQGLAAKFDHPAGLAFDINGYLYVSDRYNHAIRKISPTGMVTNIAGSGSYGYANGVGANAQFYLPSGLTVDANGNIYVADEGNNCIRKISPTGLVTTLVGSTASGSVDGVAASASFYIPRGLCLIGSNSLAVADYGNSKIRLVDIASRSVMTWAGGGATAAGYNANHVGCTDGVLTQATFMGPTDVTVVGNYLYIADSNNHCIRRMDSNGMITRFAGGNFSGLIDGNGLDARFTFPMCLSPDASGNIYVTEYGDDNIRGSHTLRRITPSGVVTTVAGIGGAGLIDGTGTNIAFNAPWGVAVDLRGNVYIADNKNNRIRVLK